MTFIDTVPEDEATGAVAAMYETDRQVFGHLPNLTTGLSLRPDVYAAWRQLNGAVKSNMDLRRYELATFAAAATSSPARSPRSAFSPNPNRPAASPTPPPGSRFAATSPPRVSAVVTLVVPP